VLLDPGQSLVLYTDGVIEARCDGIQFGEEHALGTVCVMADQPAQDIADALASAARSFSDELEDDLEVLVLRWT
jgi:phosphoserine phosphatase RsbU/P